MKDDVRFGIVPQEVLERYGWSRRGGFRSGRRRGIEQRDQVEQPSAAGCQEVAKRRIGVRVCYRVHTSPDERGSHVDWGH